MPTHTHPELPLFKRALEHGERPSLITPEGRFTYADLRDASARVALHLLGGREDLREARVAYLLPSGFRWAATQWGAWRAGGIAVPLALGQPARELAHVLDDSRPEVVVVDPQVAGHVTEVAAEQKIRILTVNELLPSEQPGSREASRKKERGKRELPELGQDRGALILYTSGTTGLPKGVLTTHGNIEAQVRSLVEAWAWSRDDHVLLVLPLHHVHGIVNVITSALWSGARCTVHPRFDPVATWDALAAGDLTLFMAVPTLYQRLLTAWEAAEPDVRARWSEGAARLRLMVSGSAALPVRVLERWEEITRHRLLERYGMTEVGMALSNPLAGVRRAGHVGAPLPQVQVRLGDESGRPAPAGASGEIQVKGPTVFQEYWARPLESRAAFTADGWFRTGDVAVCEDGSYRILGRASVDIVKTGGEKVSALEVEEVLREHPAIADCAVVGTADPEWGERLCAAVVSGSSTEALTLEALREWGRARLSGWKIPRELRLVEALPRNAMGKVDKPAVRKLFEASAR
jgi:malonyl-CoA/methylmalonyl-CoA synthetase